MSSNMGNCVVSKQMVAVGGDLFLSFMPPSCHGGSCTFGGEDRLVNSPYVVRIPLNSGIGGSVNNPACSKRVTVGNR